MKLTERPFLDLLAAFRSPAPTPGGGSASALAGSLGAALLAMVGSMPKHRAPSEADVDRLQAAARLCGEISDRLAALADEDAAAYEGVVAAYKLPKESADEKTARAGRIQQALRTATDVPLEVMRQCAAAVEQATVTAAFGNPNAASDVGVALELLGAGSRGARLNVEINLGSVKDAAYAGALTQDVLTLDEETSRGAAAARARLTD
jgi:methenyltetrahydrofolate cyclohydrolase